jgi:hypothetical protein
LILGRLGEAVLKIYTLENQIVQDKNFLFTIISYFVILAVFVNLNTLKFPLIGSAALITYFAINSVFLGNAFFRNENAFLRLMLGVLLLIILLGMLGWLTILIYNLDIVLFSLVLAIAATLSSLMNRRMKH